MFLLATCLPACWGTEGTFGHPPSNVAEPWEPFKSLTCVHAWLWVPSDQQTASTLGKPESFRPPYDPRSADPCNLLSTCHLSFHGPGCLLATILPQLQGLMWNCICMLAKETWGSACIRLTAWKILVLFGHCPCLALVP